MIKFKEFFNENALTRGEIMKYAWRFDVFKDKVINNSPFELENPEKYGVSTVTIDKESIPNLDSVDDIPAKLKVIELDSLIALGDLKKSKEFGGQAGGNKGNTFESEFSQDLENYFINNQLDKVKDQHAVREIERICGKLVKIREDGALNQKRPLRFKSDRIIVGDGNFNIGKTVSDITVENEDGKEFYLSLKYGSTVTFVNAGVAKILSQDDMEDGKIDNKEGSSLLDMLGIDNERFVSVFNDYKGDCAKKESIVITHEINASKFLTFMASVIGYGYILVHKKGSHTHIMEMTKETIKTFLKVNKATIVYPLDGCNKRVDIKIDMNNIDIVINIRNKNGKVYPSNIMADYKLN